MSDAVSSPAGAQRPARRIGRGRRRYALLICLLLLVAAVAALLSRCAAPGPATPPWVFAVCDVGQGDALFLSVGEHAAVAVDTGPDPDKENACADRLGITDVPLVVLTHFHADHVDGLAGLLRGRRVGRIETTTVDDPPAGARQVARIAAAAGIPVTRVRPDEVGEVGPVAWRVLWPQAEHPLRPPPGAAEPMAAAGVAGPGDAGRSGDGAGSRDAEGPGRASGGMAEDGPGENPGPNNDSIVMAVTVRAPDASLSLLLTGDIETPVQRILAADRGRYLRADVLKVPHHGSANQDPDFLAAVHETLSVISVGAGNPYGHPAARTVYLAGTDGARVYRTDVDGMVLISAPRSPDGPIPVRADRGDGLVPTAPPSPAGSRTGGGSEHRRHRHGGPGRTGGDPGVRHAV